MGIHQHIKALQWFHNSNELQLGKSKAGQDENPAHCQLHTRLHGLATDTSGCCHQWSTPGYGLGSVVLALPNVGFTIIILLK